MNAMFIIVIIEFVIIILFENVYVNNINANMHDMMKHYIKEFRKFKIYLETDDGGIEFVKEILEKYPENTITGYNEMEVVLLIPKVNSNSFVTAKNLRKELLYAGRYIFEYYEVKGKKINFKENSEKLYKEFEICYNMLEEIIKKSKEENYW